MNIIAVDDEPLALVALEHALKSIDIDANINSFLLADEALKYAEENTVDVAFLDIEMSDTNGILLAKQLKDIYGQTNLIFVTGHSSYALEAFSIAASGYVMKPIDEEQVALELQKLRHPIKENSKGIWIQCFGSFEVFVDGKPIMFARPKAKELLAYLVHQKGASVSKKTLVALLWEDQPYTRSLQTHFHKLVSEIEDAMHKVGVNDFIYKKNGVYAVNNERFSCDFYDFEKGLLNGINAYHGEYLSEYTWGEFTAGFLDKVR